MQEAFNLIEFISLHIFSMVERYISDCKPILSILFFFLVITFFSFLRTNDHWSSRKNIFDNNLFEIICIFSQVVSELTRRLIGDYPML